MILTRGKFYNAGDITVSATGDAGSAMGVISDADLTFTNTGSIVVTDNDASQNSVALSVSGQFASFSNTSITNSGRMEAEIAINIPSTSTDGAVKTIRNEGSGQIIGDINVGSTVAITNLGSITGDVHLGAASNSYQGEHGTLKGALYAGSVDNTLVMGTGDDRVFAAYGEGPAEDGANMISGGAGADILHSGEATTTSPAGMVTTSCRPMLASIPSTAGRAWTPPRLAAKTPDHDHPRPPWNLVRARRTQHPRRLRAVVRRGVRGRDGCARP